MKTRKRTTFFIPVIIVCVAMGQRTKAQDTTEGAERAFLLDPQTIGFFHYHGRDIRIFKWLRNDDGRPPRLWQFRYEPLFEPVIEPDGRPRMIKAQVGDKWCVRIPVRLYEKEATAAVLHELCRSIHPEHADQLRLGGISSRKIASIALTLPQRIAEAVPSAAIEREPIAFHTHEPGFDIRVYVDSEADANALMALLPGTRIQFHVTFASITADRNLVRVDYKDLRKSGLFAELDDLGTTEMYVHRYDMRELMEGMHRVVDIGGLIEAPERFDNTVFEDALKILTRVVPSEGFTDEQWAATYNPRDLEPNELQSKLYKMFTYDEAEHQWKRNAEFEHDGKANIIKVLSAESDVKAKYSDEGLKKLLHKHGVTTEVKGNIIEVKSIDLRRVTKAAFEGQGEFTSVITYVGRSIAVKKGGIDLPEAGDDQPGYPSLAARVDDLELSICPVGTILLWWGKLSAIPDGWAVCDGSAPEPPKYSEPTPNLCGRVLVGASKGRASGIEQGEALPEHTHELTTPTHCEVGQGLKVLTGWHWPGGGNFVERAITPTESNKPKLKVSEKHLDRAEVVLIIRYR